MFSIGNEFWEKTKFQYLQPVQKKDTKKPPLELEYSKDGQTIDLPEPDQIRVGSLELREAIEKRVSIRKYSQEGITLEELSYLLWCTQGVKEVIPAVTTFRTVPSAGARHAFETYLLVNNVQGLSPGVYRFLALKHALLVIDQSNDIAEKITEACLNQKFVQTAAATFFWVAVKERMTYKYGERGYRYLLLDAGHICQNLYLSAENLDCGVCAIAAYMDDEINLLLGLDGSDNFVTYVAALGKKKGFI